MNYNKVRVLFTNGVEKEYQIDMAKEDVNNFIKEFHTRNTFCTKSYVIKLSEVCSIEFV